jgi:cytochrome c peroxidase
MVLSHLIPGSEFEVLGVPADTAFSKLSAELRQVSCESCNMKQCGHFRTGSIRIPVFTAPYMHNGVFSTMDEVIDFYDKGGGAGRKVNRWKNQTLGYRRLYNYDALKNPTF